MSAHAYVSHSVQYMSVVPNAETKDSPFVALHPLKPFLPLFVFFESIKETTTMKLAVAFLTLASAAAFTTTAPFARSAVQVAPGQT